MGKRILLFVLTNLAIVVMLTVILNVLGIGRGIRPDGGIDITALAVFSLAWGMIGALISLAISRFIAKQTMGVKVVDGRTGNEEADWLYRTVERLVRQAQLPMPEVGLYDSPEVNAFATGPTKSRSLVAVSTGLLRTMRREEVEGVLAHEVAHIRNGDMVTMTLIQGVVNAFVIFLSRLIAGIVRQSSDSRNAYMLSFVVMIVLEIGLGIIGFMIVSWFSRAREFRADAGGAALAGRGNMIAALQRLKQTHELVDTRQASLATLKIAGSKSWMMLMSTHPPLDERIAALQSMR
jgi:heat shock protein HtpX